MTQAAITEKYDVVIGLEVHVQVRTQTKMFCRCANRFGAEPNTLVCPVCLGYPGVLPTPNQEAIRRTMVAGLMCHCTIAPYSKFDRKSYFYPDMPKNYQISQYDLPFCQGGHLEIGGKALTAEIANKRIGITRIHLEEDVGKSTHFAASSGLDYNRAGVPLMEVVSEPDMTTADEAWAYLTALKQVMQYADISDCDMEKGQMRCDVNVSLKLAGQREFNPKTEIKNLNSTKAVHRALLYEIERQAELLDAGGKLAQETRGWRDDEGQTYVMRTKESAHDYRYFPEPDLLPITVTPERLAELQAALPETPAARRQRYASEFGLTEYDATVLVLDKVVADYFETCVKAGGQAKKMANWIINELLRELAAAGKDVSTCPIKPGDLARMVVLIDEGVINGKIAKTVFAEMYQTGKTPDQIVKEQGLQQVTDTSAIDGFALEAITANPKQVQQYREGKTSVINFLVGQVMRLSKGKANPQIAADALKKQLDQP
jgi:aspartyl-tRNA(Asn)/glutamyl-tRNA(Gln) amidotransferase subunit B